MQNSDDLVRYDFLLRVLNDDHKLFYSALMRHTSQLMPLVYTPTVGHACLNWGRILAPYAGMYLTLNDKGSIRSKLDSWNRPVDAIVVTDGERILGLGDLSAWGMGIPVGKLALYSALAGVDPQRTLPITLDVGTNTKALLEDPDYTGLRSARIHGAEYDAFIDEFVMAVKDKFGPSVLLQWEDFGNTNAFRLLAKYQSVLPSFNDDIQGTASVVVAGLISATRLTGVPLSKGSYLFYGAGEAGAGIAELLAYAMAVEEGQADGSLKDGALPSPSTDLTKYRQHIWMVDSKGLLVTARNEKWAHHKIPFVKDGPVIAGLRDIVEHVKPTALLGVSAQGQAFTQEVVQTMQKHCATEHPIIFALSNPTSKAECTAQQAYDWTDGKAIFASGSPFDPVTVQTSKGPVRKVPGQGNNSYIFPAIGLATVACRIRELSDRTMYVAAKALADQVNDADLATGCLYPSLDKIREVETGIAIRVAEDAYHYDLADVPKPASLEQHIRDSMWKP